MLEVLKTQNKTQHFKDNLVLFHLHYPYCIPYCIADMKGEKGVSSMGIFVLALDRKKVEIKKRRN